MYVKAAAYDPNPITSVSVFIDNANKYTTSSSSVTTYIKVQKKGQHTVTVKSQDSAAYVYQSSVVVSVQ